MKHFFSFSKNATQSILCVSYQHCTWWHVLLDIIVKVLLCGTDCVSDSLRNKNGSISSHSSSVLKNTTSFSPHKFSRHQPVWRANRLYVTICPSYTMKFRDGRRHMKKNGQVYPAFFRLYLWTVTVSMLEGNKPKVEQKTNWVERVVYFSP